MRADAEAALNEAAATADPGDRWRAVMRVGEAWAALDPEAALARAVALPAELQAPFRSSVTAAWANIDAQGFLAFAERSLDPSDLTGGLRALVASHPERVFEIASRLPHDTGIATNMLQEAAMRAFAQRDPHAALRRLEAIDEVRAFERMVGTVALELAVADPDAALGWLAGRTNAAGVARRAVATGIATTDFPRAYALWADGTLAGAFDYSAPLALVADTTYAAEVAGYLLAEGTTRAAGVLESVVNAWSARDADSVVEWTLARDDAPAALVAFVARAYAVQALDRAAARLDRLPASVQHVWAVEVARASADKNVGDALEWVSRYRGQAFFEDAYAQVVVRLADTDPRRAASLIANETPSFQSAVASQVVQAWAMSDAPAAARWLEGRAFSVDPALVSNLVSRWAPQDAAAARDWVIRFVPLGRERDSALLGLIGSGARLDPRPILREIGDPQTRRSAMELALIRASADPPLAREILESAFDDPTIGAWAKQRLEQLERPR